MNVTSPWCIQFMPRTHESLWRISCLLVTAHPLHSILRWPHVVTCYAAVELRLCCLASGDSHVINIERAASVPVFWCCPIKRGRVVQRKNFKSFSKERKRHWRRQLSFISTETVPWGRFDPRILYILMHWQTRGSSYFPEKEEWVLRAYWVLGRIQNFSIGLRNRLDSHCHLKPFQRTYYTCMTYIGKGKVTLWFFL